MTTTTSSKDCNGVPARPVVVLTDGTMHSEAIDRLRAHANLRVLNAYPDEAALTDATGDAVAILARLGAVTARTIAAATRLRIIARHGAGSDSVDIAAATARGIVVTTTGDANASAVAEYTFALLLGLLRKIPAADAGMRQGRWSRDPLIGGTLEGRTLGVVGFGEVGSRVTRIARGFGMMVVTTSRPPGAPFAEALHDLLAQSDIVSLHLRLTPDTAGIIDRTAIAAMRPGAVLVNTARGELVDEAALIEALQTGHLAGAALDTYVAEPLPADSILRRLPNVILSPHVAGQTHEAIARVTHTAVQAILDELSGKRPACVVNSEAYLHRISRIGATP